MRVVSRIKLGILAMLILLMVGIFSTSYGTAHGASYYIRLISISNVQKDDDVGADEPRLFVNGQQVWSAGSFSQGETVQLNTEYPFLGDSLPITIREYDSWPGSTVTMDPGVFTVASIPVSPSTAVFTKRQAMYHLTYEVYVR
ncbi:MAG TPA: hypothetical protein VFS21_34040 [Roseiflexaceae bacterium]|nr:hypothetical protein [Roseiflexaceae bacterium]